MEEETNFKKQVAYATFSSRLLATLIDSILLLLFLQPIFSVTSHWIYGSSNPILKFLNSLNQEKNPAVIREKLYDFFIIHHNIYKLMFDQLSQLAIIMVVMIICWSYFSTSIGKKMLSLMVVDEKSLNKPTFKQSLIRFISYATCIPGVFFIRFNKKRQAWHDKIAHTIVIKS